MYWLALFNIILIIFAVGLFIDNHFVKKGDDSNAFIGFLLMGSVLGGFVISCITIVTGR